MDQFKKMSRVYWGINKERFDLEAEILRTVDHPHAVMEIGIRKRIVQLINAYLRE